MDGGFNCGKKYRNHSDIFAMIQYYFIVIGVI